MYPAHRWDYRGCLEGLFDEISHYHSPTINQTGRSVQISPVLLKTHLASMGTGSKPVAGEAKG